MGIWEYWPKICIAVFKTQEKETVQTEKQQNAVNQQLQKAIKKWKNMG